MNEWLVATILGVIQGTLEWLPVSSEGSVALALTAMDVSESAVADTQFALFLHLGTALAATVYYRADVGDVLRDVPDWRPRTAFETEADLSFLAVATLASFATGGVAYLTLETVVSSISGGAFVALIGALLVGTGILQKFAEGNDGPAAPQPVEAPSEVTLLDALLVGSLQGLAILPGVSRSGTTVSALLLRGHPGESSLRLSFLLSIPAALAAGALVLVEVGIPSISPGPALLALALSAVVGYLTVGALVSLVKRVAFWGVCVGFGSLAVVGGVLVLVV
jgi:undecaprenyl-diphosphatase